MGNISNADTTDIGLNEIYGNGNSGKIFDLFNNTVDSIKAENNFWGSGNADTVETHIFHKTDSTVLGFVDYLPLRSAKLNLKILMEAMYDNSLDILTRKDTVTVYLRETSAPYIVKDSAKSAIDTLSFNGTFSFTNAPSGQYYIVARHFNTIETWSKAGGESFVSGGNILSYDMTSSVSQAYGSNLKLKGTRYCIYSGDVDQNKIVDASDLSLMDNDIIFGLTGDRIASDLNADGIVDVTDLSLMDNNSAVSVATINP
ncbi:MAG: hypothetical protein IPH77_09985 [Ignavibacteria bacterium]|nr:hypothetical protein [Ignavibacteria bacterium]